MTAEFDVVHEDNVYMISFKQFPDVWFHIEDMKFVESDEPDDEHVNLTYNIVGKTPEMEEHFTPEFLEVVKEFVTHAIIDTAERLKAEEENKNS